MSVKKFGFLEAAIGKLTKRKATPDKEADKYEAALKENPNNIEALNALGDICAKRNENEKATDYYVRAGKLFAQDGFTLKAIAVYKKAQRVKPDSTEIYLELANLYVQKGLIGDAKANYLSAAELLSQGGSIKDSLDVYRKVVNLEPDNIHLRLKLADLYEKNNFFDEAAALYLGVANGYIDQGALHEGTELYKKVLEIQPKNVDVQFELASLYFDQNFLEEGAQVLEEIRQQYSSDPSILERIGEAYTRIRKPDQAAVIYQYLIELDPSNEAYRNKFAQLTHSDRPLPSDQPLQGDLIDLTELNQTLEASPSLNSEEPPPLQLETTSSEPVELTLQEEPLSLQFGGPSSSEEEPIPWIFPTPEKESDKGETPEDPSEADLPKGVYVTGFASEQPFPSSSLGEADSGYFDLASRLETSFKISHEYETKSTESPSESKIQMWVDSTSSALSGDVGETIKEFKKNLLEEVSEEDYETHYELGIAYKEMDLLDDAIEEFKLASLSPTKYVECCSMIGLCFAEKGNYDQAIAQLKEGLGKSGYEPEQYLSLRYELARIYEESGQPDQALNFYKEVYNENPNFMDVAQRLTQLRS